MVGCHQWICIKVVIAMTAVISGIISTRTTSLDKFIITITIHGMGLSTWRVLVGITIKVEYSASISILNMMLGWGTYSGQFTYSITEVFYYITVVMTMSLYLFLDMYLHSGEYHVGTVGIDIRNYIFTVPLWFTFILGKWNILVTRSPYTSLTIVWYKPFNI